MKNKDNDAEETKYLHSWLQVRWLFNSMYDADGVRTDLPLGPPARYLAILVPA